MTRDAHLRCTECAQTFEITTPLVHCPDCVGPLEVSFKLTGNQLRTAGTLLERFADFLPFDKIDPTLTLGEGRTPLLPATSLGERLNLRNLWFKHEGMNPTGSFKDRGSVCGAQRARSLGYRTLGTMSTGGMASSVAAYAARAGCGRW